MSSSRTCSSAAHPGTATRVPDEKEACEPYLFRQVELIRAEGGRDARQLRDEAALGQADRDHARARAGATAEGRLARRRPLPALPPGRGALHAGDADGARGGLRAAAGAARPACGAGRGAAAARAGRGRRAAVSSACSRSPRRNLLVVGVRWPLRGKDAGRPCSGQLGPTEDAASGGQRGSGSGQVSPGLLSGSRSASPEETEALAARLASVLTRATSSPSPASSAPARRPSSAAPAGRSA